MTGRRYCSESSTIGIFVLFFSRSSFLFPWMLVQRKYWTKPGARLHILTLFFLVNELDGKCSCNATEKEKKKREKNELRVVTRRVYDVDHPRSLSFLKIKNNKKRERERDERGTRRCMLFLSSFLAPVFIIILFFPSSFHSDSLSCSTRSADFITARRAVFGEQPDIFIFFPVGKSMMAQIFTSLRLVFSIIFFPFFFFFLSFWAFPKKKRWSKTKTKYPRRTGYCVLFLSQK